ncbi:MAG: methyltransferase regulatory domain-containing protein [Myxococcales bacterium]|nr:methyltransferase regulatory domain-containing protein [Myxococcales bacterium]
MHDAYETFLYDNFPFEDTHPDWLGFVGHLFGLAPAPATACRMLEIGCGLGGNLIGIASLLPDSEFVGIDLAAAQIERGRADVAALGLKNVRLEAMDVRDLPDDVGPFDYIACHGVFSWVGDEVKAAILDAVARHLAPNGVAYISFNTKPGWFARGMIRDMARRVVKPGPPPQMAADARRFFSFLREHAPKHHRLSRWLSDELAMFDQLSDRYIYFEYLVEENHPVYFDEFVAMLAPRGLGYLGDAELGTMLPERFGAAAAEAVHAWAEDQLEVEQLSDYLGGRYFRRALICRGDAPVDRQISGRRLRRCWLTSWFTPNVDAHEVPLADGVEAAFTGSDGYVLSTPDAVLKAALLALHRRAAGQPHHRGAGVRRGPAPGGHRRSGPVRQGGGPVSGAADPRSPGGRALAAPGGPPDPRAPPGRPHGAHAVRPGRV